MELLSDIGKERSLSEARELVGGLSGLREPVRDELLLHTTRIKVVRMAAALGQELQLPWASLAKARSLRIGGGRRWIAVTNSGERLDLKRPWAKLTSTWFHPHERVSNSSSASEMDSP